MKNLNILFVSDYDANYGAPHAMIELMEGLQKKGVNPILLTPYHNILNEKCDILHIENYAVRYYRWAFADNDKHLGFFLRYFPRLIRNILLEKSTVRNVESLIDFTKIDFVHTNNICMKIGATLAKRNGIAHVWHIREFGDCNLHFYRLKPFRYITKNACMVVAVSNTLRDYCIHEGVEDAKVISIYDGIKFPTILRKTSYDNCEFLRIVMVGNICEHKGQMVVIRALGYLAANVKKKVVLDFIGDANGSYAKKVRNLCYQLNLEKQVFFLEFCTDIGNRLLKYDLGIVASKSEGFGRVTVEYMAAGLLTIGAATGATKELISDGVNGFLFPYNDSKILASIIESIILKRHLIEKIGSAARQEVLEKYSLAKSVNAVYELYHSIIQNFTKIL